MPWLQPPRQGRNSQQLRLSFRHEIVRDPPEEACGVVLRYGHPRFRWSYARVAVFDDGRGDEDRRVGGEFDGDPQVPQNDVPTLFVVVGSEACYGAPSPAQVLVVLVRDGAYLGSEVERHRSKRAVFEWALEPRVVLFD